MDTSSKTGFMRAVQWEGNVRDMSVNIVPRPKLIEPEDAVVRITTSAICGSDLHIYHGLFGTEEKFGVGHEAVGIVEEVGPAVDFLKPGDRVLIMSFAEDGNLLPKPSMLVTDQPIIGLGLGGIFHADTGLQAEYARIPWADSSLAKLPDKLDDKEWLPLTDAFPTGWTAINFSGFEAGDTVAIFGAGAIGIMAAYSAIIRGAAHVYVIDHVASRLAKAASIGAQPINFTRGGKASDQILALRPQGVTRTIDAVGEVCLNDDLKPQQDYILREAVKITTSGGGIGVIGVHITGLVGEFGGRGVVHKPDLKAEIKFPIAEAWIKGIRIQGGLVDIKGNIKALVELVKSGRARPGFLFSNEYSLEDAPIAYRRFEQWEETKVTLKGARKPSDEQTLELRNGNNGAQGTNGPILYHCRCIRRFDIAWLAYLLSNGSLRHVSGPWYCKVSRIPLSAYEILCRRNEIVLDLHKKYGPVVQIAPNEVSVANFEATKQIYGTKDRWAKSDYFDHFMCYGKRSVFATKPYEDHRMRRKYMSSFYQAKAIYKLPEIEEHVKFCALSVLDQVRNGQEIDAFSLASWYASDNITFLVFGSNHRTHAVDQACIERVILGLKYQQFIGPSRYRCPWLYDCAVIVLQKVSSHFQYLSTDDEFPAWCQQKFFAALKDPQLNESHSLVRHLWELTEDDANDGSIDVDYMAAEALDNIDAA
ncbi:formaldehyde dehydrogenase [Fusarium sp. NRRL 52700]|nr:formaldehyde dehydrogenase [Fusarium sp. NRRL 52700]